MPRLYSVRVAESVSQPVASIHLSPPAPACYLIFLKKYIICNLSSFTALLYNNIYILNIDYDFLIFSLLFTVIFLLLLIKAFFKILNILIKWFIPRKRISRLNYFGLKLSKTVTECEARGGRRANSEM